LLLAYKHTFKVGPGHPTSKKNPSTTIEFPVFSETPKNRGTQETIQWLKKNNVANLCTYLEASKPYHTIDFTKPSAIVMGTESTGLTKVWIKNSDVNIIIPMQGKIDSMNVSTAAAVVVFEAKRQRGGRH